MKPTLILLLLLVIVGGSAQAQEKKFRLVSAGASINAALRVTDAVETCRNLARGGWEHSFPIGVGTHNCKVAAGLILAGIPAERMTTYLLLRGGHTKLARLSPYVWAGGSAFALLYSWMHGGLPGR